MFNISVSSLHGKKQTVDILFNYLQTSCLAMHHHTVFICILFILHKMPTVDIPVLTRHSDLAISISISITACYPDPTDCDCNQLKPTSLHFTKKRLVCRQPGCG